MSSTELPSDEAEQYAKAYLQTWCGICGGTGSDNGRQCNCLRSERTYREAAAVIKAGFLAGYRKATEQPKDVAQSNSGLTNSGGSEGAATAATEQAFSDE